MATKATNPIYALCLCSILGSLTIAVNGRLHLVGRSCGRR